MVQKKFGSAESTGRKLDVIGEYLSIYQRALSNTSLRTHYIDGFAGSGEIPVSLKSAELAHDDENEIILGSAHRALNVEPPFERFTFIDKRKDCVEALKQKFRGHANESRIRYIVGDANEQINKICLDENWRGQRGVVLLDPFGNQVSWDTITTIAETRALDLWYLFPAGLGVFRQISNSGTVHHTHEPSITRLFGTDEWKTAFLQPSRQQSLFDDYEQFDKTVTPESAALFMINRLRSVFKGGVMDEMIPLGQHAYPSYYLLFAWSNPSKKATALASKLSKAAVRATERKYGG